jgi:hypothetical protein
MTHADHRHIPSPLDKITGITADLAGDKQLQRSISGLGVALGELGRTSDGAL